jgi:hypothetical protein
MSLTNDEIQLLFDVIELQDAQLKAPSPDGWKRLIQKREALVPLLQKQREVIGTLQSGREDDLAQRLVYEARIAQLQSEICLLRAALKAAKADPQYRPNADRKS